MALSDDMTPELLREVKESYDKIQAIKEKQQTCMKTIAKTGKMNPVIRKSILCAKTMEEIEHVYLPFKPGAKRSLAERAKAQGLEEPAMSLLNNTETVNLEQFVNNEIKEVASLFDVEKGIIHIIAHVMGTNTEVLNFLRELRPTIHFSIESKKAVVKKETKEKMKSEKPVDEMKFENYFDFRSSARDIKPYQVLAINRGEHLKVLSVKVQVPDFALHQFTKFCIKKWLYAGKLDSVRKKILEEAIKDCYTRLSK